ncbi:MAG: ArdC-like ssDNA-binding domain-containing protein [Candidatus Nanopelagicales bacterium]
MTSAREDADAREQRRRDQLADIHERLTTAVADLAGSDAWQHMLHIAAHMPIYSLNNILLVAAQRPDATAVAGYRAWLAAGRQVRKGEKGIAILAPCLYKPDQAQAEHLHRAPAEAEPGAEASRVLRGFRVVHVFDLSQTDGPDLPDDPHLLTGPAPNDLWDRLAELVHDDGFALERGDCHGANGYTDYRNRIVRVRDDVEPAQAVKTLAHELGHIRADHETRFADQYRTSPRCRGRAEVEAESIAHIVTSAAGLDTGAYSVPYLAGWSGNDPSALRAAAARVLDVAAGISARLDHNRPAGPAAASAAPQIRSAAQRTAAVAR